MVKTVIKRILSTETKPLRGGGGGEGVLAMLRYLGMFHFPEHTFCWKILEQGNVLLGNPPNFFVEYVTKSQNQPYCFKSGKNVRKSMPNSGKMALRESRYWPKIPKQGVFFWPNFLNQVVTLTVNMCMDKLSMPLFLPEFGIEKCYY